MPRKLSEKEEKLVKEIIEDALDKLGRFEDSRGPNTVPFELSIVASAAAKMGWFIYPIGEGVTLLGEMGEIMKIVKSLEKA